MAKINQFEGKKILCNQCKTKSYKKVNNNPTKIIAHEKNCPLLKRLLKGSIEI
jgi:hypothetical protein